MTQDSHDAMPDRVASACQHSHRFDTRPGMHEAATHLLTTRDTLHTPRTEMLAIVRQDPVSILTQAGSRPHHGIHAPIKGVWFGPHANPLTRSETVQRNEFDGPPPNRVMKPAVMNHLSVPCINAVMRITFALADDVGAEIDRVFGTGILRRSRDPIDIACFHDESPTS